MIGLIAAVIAGLFGTVDDGAGGGSVSLMTVLVILAIVALVIWIALALLRRR